MKSSPEALTGFHGFDQVNLECRYFITDMSPRDRE